MVVPVSSLSVALQGFADYLDLQFVEDVIVSLDSPNRAAEAAKASDKSILNIFAYRLAPSGFHAEAGFQDALFLRAHVLLTCFPATQGDPDPDTDLRVLGRAISVLHSVPTIPVVLPGAAPLAAPADDFRRRNPVIYQMQAVMQAPTMEEMNHIWTTQGGELAYRLSVAYELALIPVEPLGQRPPTGPVLSAIIDVQPSPEPVLAEDGTVAFGAEAMGVPLAGANPGDPPPVNWMPVQLFATAGGLSSQAAVAAGTAAVSVALSGPLGLRAALIVTWTRAGGAAAAQAPQAFVIAAQRVDDAAARVQVVLSNAAIGDTAVITATPARANGTPVPGAPAGNVLTLTVGA